MWIVYVLKVHQIINSHWIASAFFLEKLCDQSRRACAALSDCIVFCTATASATPVCLGNLYFLSTSLQYRPKQSWRRYHGGWLPSSEDSFHSLTIIPPSALDKPRIMECYLCRRVMRWGVTAHSPMMVTLRDTQFVEGWRWNDGRTVKTVIAWWSSTSMIPVPGFGRKPPCKNKTTVIRNHWLMSSVISDSTELQAWELVADPRISVGKKKCPPPKIKGFAQIRM